MNIGLDFDDVIVDSHHLKPLVARSLFGVDIEPSRFRREFVVNKILTAEQYLKVGEEVYSGRYPFVPVPGSLEAISSLISQGHSVRIVTNRSAEQGILQPALNFLFERGVSIPVVGVPYGTSKAEACAGLDVYVDDDPIKLYQLVGVVKHLLFFCWPHNTHEDSPSTSIRVTSWSEVRDYINFLSGNGEHQ